MRDALTAAFDRKQLQDACEHCTEAAALGHRLHAKLETIILGYDPHALHELQNIHQRLSVVLARVSCARDQLSNLLTSATALARGEELP